jgi:hypothetical protein
MSQMRAADLASLPRLQPHAKHHHEGIFGDSPHAPRSGALAPPVNCPLSRALRQRGQAEGRIYERRAPASFRPGHANYF